MTITIIDRGEWEPYRPTEVPPGFPAAAMFCRRISDGVDWYEYLATGGELSADTVKMTGIETNGALVIQAVATEADRLFPQNCRLIEVAGLTETDPDALFAAHHGRIYDPVSGEIGGPYVPPAPVPDISDRQFFQQLSIDGVISEEDALAAVQTGFIPPPLQVIVDAIEDPAAKFAAKMLISGATVFQRSHPMSEAIRIARGMSPEDCDDFFRASAAL